MGLKSRSLYDIADEIVSRLDTPAGGTQYSVSFGGNQTGGYTGSQSGSDNDSSDSSQRAANPTQLDGILAGMSRDDLQNLKYALNKASMATTAFSIPVGTLLFIINPGAWAVTIVAGGVALISVGLAYLASEIDRYLEQKPQ